LAFRSIIKPSWQDQRFKFKLKINPSTHDGLFFLQYRVKRYQLNNEIKKNNIARKITIVSINEKLLVLNVGFLLYRGLRFIDLPI